MYRRPLGRPRVIAVLAALVMLVGCVLPWWASSGPAGLPGLSGNAFEGSGIVVFIVAIGVLGLVTLPYAMGDRPTALDSWLSYLLLAGVAWLGLIARVVDLAMQSAFVFRSPDELFTHGPGLLLSVLGLIMLSEAVFEMARDRRCPR